MELNDIQLKAAHFDKKGLLLVKGVAGSGKTLVGLNRIPYLLNNNAFKKDEKILLLTYTNVLIKYLDHLISENNYAGQLGLFSGNLNDNLEISTVDKIMWRCSEKYFKEKFKAKKYNVILKEYILRDNFVSFLSNSNYLQNLDLFKDEKENIKFLLEEMEWIKECNLTKEEYLEINRKGRGSRKKLFKEDREKIYTILIDFRQYLWSRNSIDSLWYKKAALEYVKSVDSHEKYSHIIVDEAQDLSTLKLEFLQNLLKDENTSTITLLYDTSQGIYPNSHFASGRHFSTLKMKATSNRIFTLKNSFRTTKEIHYAANSLLENDESLTSNEDYIKPEFINENGIKPFYTNFSSSEEEIKFTVELVNLLVNSYGYRYRDIVISARNHSNIDDILKKLRKENVPCTKIDKNSGNFKEDTIPLTTLHGVKGLEYKVVILLNLNSDVIPLKSSHYLEEDEEMLEKRLLYVGMTRAKEILVMSSFGEESKFISEINEELIIKNPTKSITLFQRLLESELEDKSLKISENSSDRFKEINGTIAFLKNENEKLNNLYKELLLKTSQEEKLEKESVKKSLSSLEIRNSLKLRYPEISNDSLQALSTGEYLYLSTSDENLSDYSSIYTSYCKSIELQLKEYFMNSKNFIYEIPKKEISKMTFGALINLARDFNYFTKLIKKLTSEKVIENRNSAAHEKSIDRSVLVRLRKVLLEENLFNELFRE